MNRFPSKEISLRNPITVAYAGTMPFGFGQSQVITRRWRLAYS